MPTKKDLLICRGVKIIKFAFTSHNSVKLFNHNAQSIELVITLCDVNKYVLLNEESSNVNVAHVLSDTNKCRSHPRPDISEALLLSIETQLLSFLK